MATERNRDWGGDWTREKLIYLKRYLNDYTTALKDQPFSLAYVDPFAGSGHWGRVSTEEGSALIALEIADKPFDRFVFNDDSWQAVNDLRRLIDSTHSDRDVSIHNLDANEFVQSVVTTLHHPWRAVVFVDPFDTCFFWDSMVSISKTSTVDALILFPRKALSRLLQRTRDASEGHHFERRLNAFWGNQTWQNVYDPQFRRELLEQASKEVVVQPALEGLGVENRDDEVAIPLLYRKRLREIFPAVSPVETILTVNNQPYFELLFAVSNSGEAAQNLAMKLFAGTTKAPI